MRGESSGIGIQSQAIESPPFLIRLAAVESGPLQFPVSPENACSENAETDMRGVLPMVRQRRVKVVHRRWPVHERDRAERRLTGRRGVEHDAGVVRKRTLVHHR